MFKTGAPFYPLRYVFFLISDGYGGLNILIGLWMFSLHSLAKVKCSMGASEKFFVNRWLTILSFRVAGLFDDMLSVIITWVSSTVFLINC